jgi:transcriptional regulator with XRE-family HTH domain
MTIGERITYLRMKKGLSQAELARLCTMGQSTLHGYESGNRSPEGMAVATARKLAEVLGVSLDYLCGVYTDEPV